MLGGLWVATLFALATVSPLRPERGLRNASAGSWLSSPDGSAAQQGFCLVLRTFAYLYIYFYILHLHFYEYLFIFLILVKALLILLHVFDIFISFCFLMSLYSYFD